MLLKKTLNSVRCTQVIYFGNQHQNFQEFQVKVIKCNRSIDQKSVLVRVSLVHVIDKSTLLLNCSFLLSMIKIFSLVFEMRNSIEIASILRKDDRYDDSQRSRNHLNSPRLYNVGGSIQGMMLHTKHHPFSTSSSLIYVKKLHPLIKALEAPSSNRLLLSAMRATFIVSSENIFPHSRARNSHKRE